jgi:hypothetical protein
MGSVLTKRERLRRVVLLCCHFMRNLAYYRVGHPGEPRAKDREFWLTVNGNFMDQCVLEWCKLFGDTKGEHAWPNIVSEPAAFEAALLSQLSISAADLEAYRVGMREYRDKFVAHLNSERVMNIPNLDTAKASVAFYHGHSPLRRHHPSISPVCPKLQRACPNTTSTARTKPRASTAGFPPEHSTASVRLRRVANQRALFIVRISDQGPPAGARC